MVAATVCKRIVFGIFHPKQFDHLDEVLPAGCDSALHALVEG